MVIYAFVVPLELCGIFVCLLPHLGLVEVLVGVGRRRYVGGGAGQLEAG